MVTVHRGVPSGKQKMDLFGRGVRRKQEKGFSNRRSGKSSTSYKKKGKKKDTQVPINITNSAFEMLTKATLFFQSRRKKIF